MENERAYRDKTGKILGRMLWALMCVLLGSLFAEGSINGTTQVRIGTPDAPGSWNERPPYFFGDFDAAGFSDWIYYGPSPEHNYSYHEVLSGEWAAAIYYDGIDTERIDPDMPAGKAMWLTERFDFPDWYTGSDFGIYGTYKDGNDPNNPTPEKNYAQSFIRNPEVEVQIDYEVVDLHFRDPNLYLSRSPLSFLEPDVEDPNLLRSAYIESDRYIFLQTYTITNITDNPLTNLAFYQMLHSHGADEYGPYVSSTYCTFPYPDPLEDYEPKNPVHQVGDFRFDITQWNHWPDDYTDIGTPTTHRDYVGFSSAVAPNWIDNDVFRGHSGKPTIGTHINIENRELNGENHIFLDEVAGAMGWHMGTLEPEESISRTVSFMFAYGGKPIHRHHLYVSKIDDVMGCFDPTDPNATITYAIFYGNNDPNDVDYTNVVLVDYLPPETNRMSVQPSGNGVYDLFTNTVTWNLGTLHAEDFGQVSVTANFYNAPPGKELVNKVVLTSDVGLAQYTLRTPVCELPLGDVIYVDKFAPGPEDGLSWPTAFRTLQAALARAENGHEIWIADGTYKPGPEVSDSFVVPDGVSIYGGFAGYGAVDPYERNWKRHKTILSGRILSMPDGTGGEIVYRNNTVVKMGDDSLLDGVTVEEGDYYGIYGSENSFEVTNCFVTNNRQRGIYCENGNLAIQWSVISNNGHQGIYHDGTGKTLTVENSKIYYNRWDGIYTSISTSIILNSLIFSNGASGNYFGVNLVSPYINPTIRNNTIVHNTNEGIRFVGSNEPVVRNNILYYNNEDTQDKPQLSGITVFDHCCIYDPNDPNGINMMPDMWGNITSKPGFVYGDEPGAMLFYLDASSLCRDAGDSNIYTDEYGLAGNPRVYGIRVDIGAYEVVCEDTSHPLDWNFDGVINYHEFNLFSRAWLTHDPNDPSLSDPNMHEPIFYNWNPTCNMDTTGDSEYIIDLADLLAFLDNWLWVACWKEFEESTAPAMPRGSMQMFGSSQYRETFETAVITETKTIEEQILDLQTMIEFLEILWLKDPAIQQEIDSEKWERFMEAVYRSLYELRDETIKINQHF